MTSHRRLMSLRISQCVVEKGLDILSSSDTEYICHETIKLNFGFQEAIDNQEAKLLDERKGPEERLGRLSTRAQAPFFPLSVECWHVGRQFVGWDDLNNPFLL